MECTVALPDELKSFVETNAERIKQIFYENSDFTKNEEEVLALSFSKLTENGEPITEDTILLIEKWLTQCSLFESIYGKNTSFLQQVFDNFEKPN